VQLLVVSRSPDLLAAVLRLSPRERPLRFVGFCTAVICESTCCVLNLGLVIEPLFVYNNLFFESKLKLPSLSLQLFLGLT
jgi:hypothetical protein